MRSAMLIAGVVGCGECFSGSGCAAWPDAAAGACASNVPGTAASAPRSANERYEIKNGLSE
jgi:hypothetical protein